MEDSKHEIALTTIELCGGPLDGTKEQLFHPKESLKIPVMSYKKRIVIYTRCITHIRNGKASCRYMFDGYG